MYKHYIYIYTYVHRRQFWVTQTKIATIKSPHRVYGDVHAYVHIVVRVIIHSRITDSQPSANERPAMLSLIHGCDSRTQYQQLAEISTEASCMVAVQCA